MKEKVQHLVFKYFRFLLLVALFVFFSLTTTTFWSPTRWDNISNILLKQAPFSILMAICMTLSIIIGGLDLSIGASVALISCTSGKLLLMTGSIGLAIVAAVVIGVLIGLCNGVLIAKIRLPIFIATYSMKWILQGLALIVTGGQQVFGFGNAYAKIFTSSRYTFLIICVVISAIVAVLLGKTNFGRKLYATGSNPSAAMFSGIRVERIKIITYVISGFIMSIVSLMYIANLSASDPVVGSSYAINAVAATLVGGSSMGGGHGKTSNAVIGALIFLILTNGLILLGVSSLWQECVIGVVILLSVAFEQVLQKYSPDAPKKKAA